ncbi:hypothetical protein PEP31012_01020 [Pandoraea eparura]|uniref:HNH endonuclease n=1 Tax=Pandoraea eparura TaxID=2508291 RepID=A0A5E4SZE1_9BURK|nr:hypothetical protein [Pandoraea eparura]VVD79534.1 hypothetical protein PEP31012_01020 [Pandoraea eparura]
MKNANSNRDDFSRPVIRALAARAGWQCCFDGCSKLTVGPSEEGPDKITTIGIAAHICAASPNFRRYDPNATHDQRSDISNGIWLCSDHATLIDRDDVTYSETSLRAMKRRHEEACARAVRVGSSSAPVSGLVALGPAIIVTATIAGIESDAWTFKLSHFLAGDPHEIATFIGSFSSVQPYDKYVLCNELGDGRAVTGAPSLKKDDDGYVLRCPVSPIFPRTDVRRIGSGLATNDESNDLFLDAKGDIACVSGSEYFPQRVKEVLSMQRGESPFHRGFGMRFFEYFQSYSGSPWLDLLFKLDVIRQASIPYEDTVTGRHYTPLQCVTRVHTVELLSDQPSANRLPVRLRLDVNGLGTWERELRIYMPTAEQMAEIANRPRFD